YEAPGHYTVRGRVEDKDGGFTDKFLTVDVVAPPRVTSLAVNGGGAQRSMVTSLVVTFSQAVSAPPTGPPPVVLTRTGTGGVTGAVNVNYLLSALGTSMTITFAPGGAVGIDGAGSLRDGIYSLTLTAGLSGPGGQL